MRIKFVVFHKSAIMSSSLFHLCFFSTSKLSSHSHNWSGKADAKFDAWVNLLPWREYQNMKNVFSKTHYPSSRHSITRLPPVDYRNTCGNRPCIGILNSGGGAWTKKSSVSSLLPPFPTMTIVKPPPPNKLQCPTFRFHFNRRRRWRRLNLGRRRRRRW